MRIKIISLCVDQSLDLIRFRICLIHELAQINPNGHGSFHLPNCGSVLLVLVFIPSRVVQHLRRLLSEVEIVENDLHSLLRGTHKNELALNEFVFCIF